MKPGEPMPERGMSPDGDYMHAVRIPVTLDWHVVVDVVDADLHTHASVIEIHDCPSSLEAIDEALEQLSLPGGWTARSAWCVISGDRRVVALEPNPTVTYRRR